MLCQLKKPFFIDLEPFFDDYLHEQIKIIGRRFGGGGGGGGQFWDSGDSNIKGSRKDH